MIITVKELMDEYKISRTTVYKWIKKGMPVMKVEGVVRFDKQEVREWFSSQERKVQ